MVISVEPSTMDKVAGDAARRAADIADATSEAMTASADRNHALAAAGGAVVTQNGTRDPPPAVAADVTAAVTEKDTSLEEQFRGIGKLTTFIFLAQASALLASSFLILLRSISFSILLLARSAWLEIPSFFNRFSPEACRECLMKETTVSNDGSTTSKEIIGGALSPLELYQGTLVHTRTRPIGHSFSYPVRMALVNLDHPPPWFLESSASGHVSADRARELAGTDGPVFLLTNPASVGYEQNPISVYYCYRTEDASLSKSENQQRNPEDAQGQGCLGNGKSSTTQYSEEEEEYGLLPSGDRLALCIAEVTNTPWLDKVMFTFQPGKDIVAKPMHVSPFMDMESDWRITTSAPGQSLQISFRLHHHEMGDFFLAHLAMRSCTKAILRQGDTSGLGRVGNHAKMRRELSLLSQPCLEEERRAIRAQRFLWLMPQLVAFWIYIQAVKLWWKGCPLFTHPKYSDRKDYRLEPLAREWKRASCCSFINGRQVSRSQGGDGKARDGMQRSNDASMDVSPRERIFLWYDSVEWPWGVR